MMFEWYPGPTQNGRRSAARRGLACGTRPSFDDVDTCTLCISRPRFHLMHNKDRNHIVASWYNLHVLPTASQPWSLLINAKSVEDNALPSRQ